MERPFSSLVFVVTSDIMSELPSVFKSTPEMHKMQGNFGHMKKSYYSYENHTQLGWRVCMSVHMCMHASVSVCE